MIRNYSARRQQPSPQTWHAAVLIFDSSEYLALEEKRKTLQVATEQLRNERNASAKNIGKAKAQGENIEPLLAAVKDLGNKLDST